MIRDAKLFLKEVGCFGDVWIVGLFPIDRHETQVLHEVARFSADVPDEYTNVYGCIVGMLNMNDPCAMSSPYFGGKESQVCESVGDSVLTLGRSRRWPTHLTPQRSERGKP